MDLVRDRECFTDFRISSRMESQSANNGVRRKNVLDWHCCCYESKWKKIVCAPTETYEDTVQGQAHVVCIALGCPWLQKAPL